MNLYLRLPYFLTDLGELGTENLHLNASVYQINHNRSSGNHSADQGSTIVSHSANCCVRDKLNCTANQSECAVGQWLLCAVVVHNGVLYQPY